MFCSFIYSFPERDKKKAEVIGQKTPTRSRQYHVIILVDLKRSSGGEKELLPLTYQKSVSARAMHLFDFLLKDRNLWNHGLAE